MKGWIKLNLAVLVTSSFASLGQAQAPPPVAAPAPAAAVAVATATPAAPVNNVWTFLCLSPAQREACRVRWCASGLGQMATAMAGPASLMTGGLCRSHCLQPSVADLALPPTTAAGAAAKIKQDELEAAARRADVRYLGTVDCHYWPEAEEALINALRGDRNECVRLEAALALTRGCCCTQRTIEALTISVSGSDRDGFPSEKSERVRCVAAEALAHCTHVYHKVSPAPLPTIEEKLPLPVPYEKTQINPKDYYQKIGATVTKREAMEKAEKTLATTNLPTQYAPLQAPKGTPRGSEGLFGLVARAVVPPTSTVAGTVDPTTGAPIPVTTVPAAAPTSVAPTSVAPANVAPTNVAPASMQQPAPIERRAPTGTFGTPSQTAPASAEPVQPAPRPAARGLIPLVIHSFRPN